MNSISVLDNSNNEANVSHLFDELSVSYQLLKSSNGIDKLNQEISSIIGNNLEDLILQVNNIEILEQYLSTIQTKISSLLTDLEKLRTRFNDLYNKISYRIVLLNRLHSTCDLLRRIIRFMNISKRLQQTEYSCADVQVARREIKKASQYVWELNSLIAQDDNLLKIEIIRNDLLQLGEKQNDILEIAISNFESGFQKQDANQISVGLQVFFCFNLLQEKIKNFLSEKEDVLFQSAKEVFCIQSYAQSKLSGPGGAIVSIATAQSAVFRSKFWSNLEALIKEMHTSLIQVDLLFRILKKKRDPMNQVYLIDFISEANSLSVFISKINSNFFDQMTKAANISNLIKECLEADYPKLVKVMIELWTRLREEKEIDIEKDFRATLSPFESAYLSRSVSFMFDSVNSVFSDAKESAVNHTGSLVPTKEAIDTIIKTISNQLVISSVDANLNQAVGKNIAKVVQLFFVKCEQLILVDGDATQVIGPSTKSQAINSSIVHRLESFRESMLQLLASCEVDLEAKNLIESALADVDAYIYNVIDPLMNSVQDSIEAIILTIHSEDFSNFYGSSQCSLYMRELQGFLTRVQSDYFQMFPATASVRTRIQKVTFRTIELFLRHATLIRPLSQAVKMRLAIDFAQLEEALSAFGHIVGDLGKQYRLLRSFKPLLFQEAQVIADSPLIGNLVPYSLAIQFLISAYGPPEMKSAHENRGWSVSRYTTWMDEHTSEQERMILFKETLESYVKTIRSKEVKSFPSIYSLVLEMLKKGLNK